MELIASMLRLSTPLLFAAAGGLLCERAGIATICLEGAMLVGAWTAAVVNADTQSPWLALVCGLGAGALTMSIHSFLTLYARADHIVSGVAVNLFAAGLTPLLSKVLFGSTTSTPAIPIEHRFQAWPIPILSSLPGWGSLFCQVPLVYVALLTLFVIHWLIRKTSWGLWLHSAGDGPEALETAGISPRRVRVVALALGGALAGLGGVYLSIAHASQFTRDMTAGRGFIALTALIFGKWKPIPTFLACLFFGLADALQIQLQSTPFFGRDFPVQFIQALPYLITLLVLVLFVGRAKPPAAIGKALER